MWYEPARRGDLCAVFELDRQVPIVEAGPEDRIQWSSRLNSSVIAQVFILKSRPRV